MLVYSSVVVVSGGWHTDPVVPTPRNYSARSGKLCVLDLRLDQKIDGASGCLHSCMHCGEVRVIPWKLVHRMPYSAVQSSVDEFRSQDWPKAELGSTHGIDLVYSILSPEWNADKTRVDKVRY
jgi:hypothetical protein